MKMGVNFSKLATRCTDLSSRNIVIIFLENAGTYLYPYLFRRKAPLIRALTGELEKDYFFPISTAKFPWTSIFASEKGGFHFELECEVFIWLCPHAKF